MQGRFEVPLLARQSRESSFSHDDTTSVRPSRYTSTANTAPMLPVETGVKFCPPSGLGCHVFGLCTHVVSQQN
ncbi:MAG: hypothetical protein ACI9OJ_003426 [Myxococcota bacterium]